MARKILRKKKLYKDALKAWGVDFQYDMMMEECAELIDAILKFRRRRISVTKLAEEVADVQNMAAQMEHMLPPKMVERIRYEKLLRTEKVVKEGTK